jgi:hypothetical protein
VSISRHGSTEKNGALIAGGGGGAPVGVRVGVREIVGVDVVVADPVRVGVTVPEGVRVGVEVVVCVRVAVAVPVWLGVKVAVAVELGVMVGVFVRVGVAVVTVYWYTWAQLETVHAVQVAQVPLDPSLLPKISMIVPVVFQALTMYLTVVPPGCAGIVALTTSTFSAEARSKNEQAKEAVRTCVVPVPIPRMPDGVEPSVVK